MTICVDGMFSVWAVAELLTNECRLANVKCKCQLSPALTCCAEGFAEGPVYFSTQDRIWITEDNEQVHG